nr:hypothetical protein [Treponema sp.]
MKTRRFILILAAAVALSSLAFADDGGAYNTESQTEANGTEKTAPALARAALGKPSQKTRFGFTQVS